MQLTILACLALLLAGCSGLMPYRSTAERNLVISTETQARGFLARVDASLDIYEMRGDCDAEYRGTVDLGDPRVEIGVPSGRPALLVFNFASSALLSGSSGSMSYDVVLHPLPGHVYDVDVTYRNNIYNVDMRERSYGAVEGQPMVIAMRDPGCNGRS